MLLIASTLGAALSFGYRTYARIEAEERDLPQLAAASLVRELRAYHKALGRFPESFEELDRRRKVEGRAYELSGRAISARHYFYVMSALDAHRVTVWAIPAGPRREEAATHFIVVEPEELSVWKGAAIPIADVAAVHSNPTRGELAALGLVEQPRASGRERD